ncbi:MAG: hypothetical protein IIZ47_06650 [Erysipelotrichaceae bacterium]|nr:hypothetical protein [Erysipelotrichaceae bacterium]
MSEKKKQYTPEEIKAMSYWQLWGLRREGGPVYHVMTVSFYAFMVYLLIKVYYLFASRDLEGLKFSLDWWSIPLAVIAGLAYWYGHEAYYRHRYLNIDNKKEDR